jgi:hypothetical protein
MFLSAQMQEVSEEELSTISAQAGINVNYGDFGVHVSYDSIRISDTDHDPKNRIEFNNFSISGPDGYFKLDCPEDFPMTIDVGTITTIDSQTKTVASFQLSDHINPRTWTIGNLVFCSQDLGNIVFDTSTVDPAYYMVSGRTAPGTGIEFEYLTKWLTNDFAYTYNTVGGSFHVNGIHLAETASGTADDPSDPSTWEFSGYFRIGDVIGGQIDSAASSPATIDVATDTSTATPTTSLYLNLPMKGTVRIADVSLGGTSFGPVAIDGITVHHLGLKFGTSN